MRKLLLAGAAILTLAAASPALAADNSGNAAGAAAGAATGGTIGFIFGGPIGAVIGGFSGAVLGSGVSDAAVTYAGNHPVDVVYVSDNIDVGYRVGDNIKVYPIEGDDAHGYFYANNRVWIVDLGDNEVVSSPGYVVSDRAVAFVKANPTASISVKGDIEPGFKLGGGVDVTSIDGVDGYGYVYVDDQPVIVDTGTNVVVWVG
jgi:hypothetical protein